MSEKEQTGTGSPDGIVLKRAWGGTVAGYWPEAGWKWRAVHFFRDTWGEIPDAGVRKVVAMPAVARPRHMGMERPGQREFDGRREVAASWIRLPGPPD